LPEESPSGSGVSVPAGAIRNARPHVDGSRIRQPRLRRRLASAGAAPGSRPAALASRAQRADTAHPGGQMTMPATAAVALYSVQIAAVVTAAEIASRVFAVPEPGTRLRYWRAVLVTCLALPFLPSLSPSPLTTAAAPAGARLLLAIRPLADVGTS